jgi:hypothetical protein
MIAQCIRDRVLSGEPMTRICEAVDSCLKRIHLRLHRSAELCAGLKHGDL